MRKLFFCLLAFSCSASLALAQQFSLPNQRLKALLDKGEYFQFRTEFEGQYKNDYHFFYPTIGQWDTIFSLASLKDYFEDDYFFAWETFLFNEPELSNSGINVLLNNKYYSPSDSVTAELLSLHFQNDLRLFHYKTADSICTLLSLHYSNVMDKETLDGIKNSGKVTAALKNIPPQTMERNGDMDVKFKRDIASLIHIPVEMNGKEAHFVMDSGANLSTVSESEAEKMGIKILDADFGVTSSSRAAVESKLGVADKIQIGNVTFRNVVFIVLPDKSLSFLGGLYKIKGIIGLPVIAQLGEIQIKKDGHVFSPAKQTASDERNFGLEGNTPFINVNFFGEYHPYIFDTGAATGIYGGKFITTYSDSLKNVKKSSSKVGGAGGMQTISILRIKNLHYEIGSAKNILKAGTVQLSGNEAIFSSFYGIVGEDIFSQWDTVTINFDRMFVVMK